jgi:branched-chain amino acid transport system ATP-binding protein
VTLLAIEGLEVRYGAVVALRGISLRIEKGEIVALVGPNGAGKSSVMSAVAGLVNPAGGTVSYDGELLGRSRPESRAARGISLVPEGRHIFHQLTVRENLLLAFSTRNDDDRDSDYQDVLARFPALQRLESNPAGRLSGGEQQQLALARALLTRPRLLLLDEPSLGLAPLIVEQVFQTLAELREEGVTVLLVEQYARRAVELADHSYVLGQGAIVLEGRRDELLASGELEAAYLGKAEGQMSSATNRGAE